MAYTLYYYPMMDEGDDPPECYVSDGADIDLFVDGRSRSAILNKVLSSFSGATMRLRILALALLVASAASASTPTFTPTITPTFTWTPTATPTATQTANANDIEGYQQATTTPGVVPSNFTGTKQWGAGVGDALGRRGGKLNPFAYIGAGKKPGDTAGDVIPLANAAISGISAGQLVAFTITANANVAFGVSPASSLMDQNIVGIAVNSQKFLGGTVWVQRNGLVYAYAGITVNAGAVYVGTSNGALTATSAVSDSTLYTGLSNTTKIIAMESFTPCSWTAISTNLFRGLLVTK